LTLGTTRHDVGAATQTERGHLDVYTSSVPKYKSF
jgi:hypothetical protein